MLPSHLHLILRAKEESSGLSNIIRDFKKYTSKALIDWVLNDNKESRSDWLKVVFKYHADKNLNNKNYQIWKQNNQPKELIHSKFIRQKLQYIHNNPVVTGIVFVDSAYKYSSARQYANSQNIGALEVKLLNLGIEERYVFT